MDRKRSDILKYEKDAFRNSGTFKHTKELRY